MKQVQVSVHSEYAELICDILEDQEIDHYVLIPRAEGRNNDGRHEGTQVFPGTLMLAFIRVPDDKVDALLEKLAEFRDEKKAHEHLEALVLPIERQL